MKLATRFEWLRWIQNVLIFLTFFMGCMTIVVFICIPVAALLMHNANYQFPTFYKSCIMIICYFPFSIFIGTILWYDGKKKFYQLLDEKKKLYPSSGDDEVFYELLRLGRICVMTTFVVSVNIIICTLLWFYEKNTFGG